MSDAPVVASKCSVCNHPRLDQIHRRIIRAHPLALVARLYGIKYQTLQHHATEHMPRQIAAALDAIAKDPVVRRKTGWDFVHEGKRLYGECMRVLHDAHMIFDNDAQLRAIGEARQCLTYLARLAGRFPDQRPPQVNPIVTIDLGQVMIEAYRRSQDAKLTSGQADGNDIGSRKLLPDSSV